MSESIFLNSSIATDIQREQEKVKRSIKDAAKKGQKDVCVVLAKEMIQSKRAITKLYASKAQMNSILLSMKNQLGELVRTVSVIFDWEITFIKFCKMLLTRYICFHCVFLAVLRVAGAMQKSTEVMKAMQNLVKIPEIQATMRELSKEMTKVSSSIQQ